MTKCLFREGTPGRRCTREYWQTVLVKSMELSVHGLQTARVLSNVFVDLSEKNKQKFVILRLINFSAERLDILIIV